MPASRARAYVEPSPTLRYHAAPERLASLRRPIPVRELRSHVLENGTHGTGMPSGASVRGGHAVGVEGRRNSGAEQLPRLQLRPGALETAPRYRWFVHGKCAKRGLEIASQGAYILRVASLRGERGATPQQ